METTKRNSADLADTPAYRITADAIVGRGNVFRSGQTVTEADLHGFGELFADWGAVEKLEEARPASLI